MRSTRTNLVGFTLVEVLVISPIIILFVGMFIALLVTLTGESLVVREKNSAIYDTQSALDDMQASVTQSTAFLSTTGTIQSPQGKNNSSGTAFTDVTAGQPDALLLQLPATNKNPRDPTRTLIYTGAGACNSINPLHTYTVIYFVDDDAQTSATNDFALYKRTVLSTATPCTTVWQRGSCRSTVINSGNASICMTSDDRLLGGATSIGLEVKYYTGTGVARDNNAPTATDSSAVITVTKQIAGEAVTHSASMRAASLNSQIGS